MTRSELIMLARVLSQRENVTVEIAGNEAYCSWNDGKFKINVPIPCSCELENAYYRGYLDHELGHVQFSDMAAINSLYGAMRLLVNVLEDVYVERRMGDMYPGAKVNLRRLSDSIFTEVHAGRCLSQVICAADAVLLLVLYKRRGIQHSLDEIENKCRELDVPVDDINRLLERQTYCTADNIKLAEELFALFPDAKQTPSVLLKATVETAINDAFEDMQGDLDSEQAKGRMRQLAVTKCGSTISEAYEVFLSARIYGSLMRTLPPLLQSVQYRAGRIGYQGRLGRDVYRVALSDTRVFERKAERMARGVQVVLLADYSSSMLPAAESMNEAIYAMLHVLRTVPNVKASAWGFSDMIFGEIKYKHPMRFPYTIGLTPTGDAMMRLLPHFDSTKRRILFLFTDGNPSDDDIFQGALAFYKSQCIEVYGVGMQGMNVSRWFDEDHRVEVDDMENDFAPMVCELLKKALVKCVLRQ